MHYDIKNMNHPRAEYSSCHAIRFRFLSTKDIYLRDEAGLPDHDQLCLVLHNTTGLQRKQHIAITHL